jgi:hypothetical protein
VARAVDATVTVEVQSLAAAGTLAAQPTAVAVPPPAVGTAPLPHGAAPTALPPPAGPASPTTVAAPGCAIQPVRGFGLLYATAATVAARLGCPVEPETGLPTSIQKFEGGTMIEIAPRIFVLRGRDGTWSSYPDAYQPGRPLPTPGLSPPAGRFAPTGGFGLVWQEHAPVRQQLGWATAAGQDFPNGATEMFAHGRMIWTPDKVIYVLDADNTWQSFPDNFPG